MNGFSPCATGVGTVPVDPYKRVNFVPGFVLGADDLTQESAFLANRAEGLARDLIGYGTVSGLRVTRETLPGGGAGLVVGAGLALSPRGRPIVVTMPHAVALDEWLDSRRNDLVYHLTPGFDSPPGDLLHLFVVLAYRQCATDDKPAPGEPCRTDEPPRLFTRLADAFTLELRFRPPEQMQDDAIRALLTWLRSVEIVDAPGGTSTRDGVLDALRASALGSPPTGTLASPPEPLRVYRGDVAEIFSAALGVWVTELRPFWQTTSPPDDAVLLAEVDVPLTAQLDGGWHVQDIAQIIVRTDRRPYLLPLRLIQELALAGSGAAPFRIEAAGIVVGDTNSAAYRQPRFNGLRVVGVADGEVTIAFDGYRPPAPSGPFQYVVKVLSQTRPALPTAPVIVNLRSFETNGIRLGVTDATGAAIVIAELATTELAIEITRYVA